MDEGEAVKLLSFLARKVHSHCAFKLCSYAAIRKMLPTWSSDSKLPLLILLFFRMESLHFKLFVSRDVWLLVCCFVHSSLMASKTEAYIMFLISLISCSLHDIFFS